MRLKKKIMRGVTAAVLAAALLTACAGGGEAPAPSNPDNNTMGGRSRLFRQNRKSRLLPSRKNRRQIPQNRNNRNRLNQKRLRSPMNPAMASSGPTRTTAMVPRL